MTFAPANHADLTDSAPGVAFVLHPAHLGSGPEMARLPAFESVRPRPAYQGPPVAPPWVSPYRTLRWALPRAERWIVLAPSEMPASLAPPAELPPPAEAAVDDEAAARPYAALPPATNHWAPAKPPPAAPYPAVALSDSFDEPDAPPFPRPRRRWKYWAAGGAGLLAAAMAAAAVILPRMLAPRPITAVFTAPRLILRAAGDGQVGAVAVTAGENVQPDTTLLTIRPGRGPSPTALALRAQLASARIWAATLDAAMAQPAGAGDTGRLRQSEQQRLRKSVAGVIGQLQVALDANTPRPAPDSPVQAGVHGVVLSLDAQPGAATAKNAPLIQLLDCGRAFLALQPGGAPLHAGQSVQVSLPPLPPFIGTIRASEGIAEPANALVVAPTGLPAGACPIGRTATITPATVRTIASVRS